MKIREVRKFFRDKEYEPCPLTEKLVKAGYQQVSGGYIDRAKKEGLLVDYTQSSPSQYWHLMTYCESQDPNKVFSKNIVCGELIFWMAEVANCVPRSDLEHLVNSIISHSYSNDDERPIYDRRKWNKAIQDLCFDNIAKKVTETF